MPLIKVRSSLGANAQAFPLQGNQYEILTFDALVEIALLADAAGVVNGTVHSGTDLLMSNTHLDTLAVATPITYPDDYSLSDYADAKLLTIIFTCNHCPTAQYYEERIKQLVSDYQPKGVAFVAISPNDPEAAWASHQVRIDTCPRRTDPHI